VDISKIDRDFKHLFLAGMSLVLSIQIDMVMLIPTSNLGYIPSGCPLFVGEIL
jgi:hypothetical protein